MTGCSDLDQMFQKVPDLSNPVAITLLENTYQEYQNWEVWDLVDKSHQGPWTQARANLDPEETSTVELDPEELIKFANALQPTPKS